MYFVKPNNFLLIVTLLFFNFSFKVFAVEKLDGAWFECEFSGKTSQPTDNCEMLDNDGFIFSNNIAAHISVIDSQETNCKKNKIGQCFQSNISFITVRQGRKDKVKFEDSKLILTFLGCGQVFYLTSKIDYIQAKPDAKKCFWAGKKIFYLKKYNGKLIFKK
jgi:hypothetical protein|tara:strand:- start:271 stop:756 length:486 start_codon:yes stop_codon:yes gene_type:complete